MKPDPNRKPTKAEMRAGGMVALAALVVLGILTAIFILGGG